MAVFRVRNWDMWASKFASRYLRKDVARAVAPRLTSPPEHNLVLYEFEASPWCRLVREYATILDLTLSIRPCPRETIFFGEGSFSKASSFRMEAMEWHQNKIQNNPNDNHVQNSLTFPLLVDTTTASARTTDKKKTEDGDSDGGDVVILNESYDILKHLWENYGESVLPTDSTNPRRDQMVNAPSLSFARRFFSLAGPSYVRPWPRCGLMLFPSTTTTNLNTRTTSSTRLVLYQAEGCPESRLVREALCSLMIPYVSVPVAEGSSNHLPQPNQKIPVISLEQNDDDQDNAKMVENIVGAENCLDYLHEAYYYSHQHESLPHWLDPIPRNNLGCSDGARFSVVSAAFAAIQKGSRDFVPDQAMK